MLCIGSSTQYYSPYVLYWPIPHPLYTASQTCLVLISFSKSAVPASCHVIWTKRCTFSYCAKVPPLSAPLSCCQAFTAAFPLWHYQRSFRELFFFFTNTSNCYRAVTLQDCSAIASNLLFKKGL